MSVRDKNGAGVVPGMRAKVTTAVNVQERFGDLPEDDRLAIQTAFERSRAGGGLRVSSLSRPDGVELELQNERGDFHWVLVGASEVEIVATRA